jgi:hypothetical protein
MLSTVDPFKALAKERNNNVEMRGKSVAAGQKRGTHTHCGYAVLVDKNFLAWISR